MGVVNHDNLSKQTQLEILSQPKVKSDRKSDQGCTKSARSVGEFERRVSDP